MKKIKVKVNCTRREFFNGKFHDKESMVHKVNIITEDESNLNRDYLQNEHFSQLVLRIDDDVLNFKKGHYDSPTLIIEDF